MGLKRISSLQIGVFQKKEQESQGTKMILAEFCFLSFFFYFLTDKSKNKKNKIVIFTISTQWGKMACGDRACVRREVFEESSVSLGCCYDRGHPPESYVMGTLMRKMYGQAPARMPGYGGVSELLRAKR